MPRLVLDASAIAAWTRGSVAVGELLAEIDAEHGAVAIPLNCMVEAASATIADRDLLEILVGHPATMLLGDDPGDWPVLAGLRTVLGELTLASAALIALDAGINVLTSHQSLYEKLGGGGMTIGIED